MQISIPDNLTGRLNRLAKRRQQTIEDIVIEQLFTALDDELGNLPTREQVELRALHYLSDDALRSIAAEQMPLVNQTQMAALMSRHTLGSITAPEQELLTELVERGDQLTLRKAEAVNILVNRGFTGDVTALLRANV